MPSCSLIVPVRQLILRLWLVMRWWLRLGRWPGRLWLRVCELGEEIVLVLLAHLYYKSFEFLNEIIFLILYHYIMIL